MHKKLCMISICLVLFTGCWDKIEIDDTAFVIAIGVDVKKGQYQVSYVFPNLPVYTGRKEGDSLFIRTVTDATLAGAVKKLAVQMSKTINFEHLETVVIGTSLLSDKTKLYQLTDYLGRSNEYPRRIPVLTAMDPQGVLQPDHTESEAVGQYIQGIYENNQSVMGNYKLVLQDFLKKIEYRECLLFPFLHTENGIYEIRNAFIYKDAPLGVLRMEELESLSWLNENAKGMDYTIQLDEGHVSLEIDEAISKYEYSQLDKGLEIRIGITTKMHLMEHGLQENQSLDMKELRKLESLAERQLKHEVEEILDIMQRKYRVDLVSFLDSLKFQNPQLYLQQMEDWDRGFPNASFRVVTHVIIENIGIKE